MMKSIALKAMAVAGSVAMGILVGRVVVSQGMDPRRAQATPPRKQVIVNSGSASEIRITFKGYTGRPTPSPKPGFLVVDAKAHVMNFAGTQPFRWYLKVIKNTKPVTVVLERFYDHQAFPIETGKFASPTFYEEVPLPPGRYQAMLQIRSYADIFDRAGNVDESNFAIASSVLAQQVP
jgi:hypothetical protein